MMEFEKQFDEEQLNDLWFASVHEPLTAKLGYARRRSIFDKKIMATIQSQISQAISAVQKEAKEDIEWQKSVAFHEGYDKCLRVHKKELKKDK